MRIREILKPKASTWEESKDAIILLLFVFVVMPLFSALSSHFFAVASMMFVLFVGSEYIERKKRRQYADYQRQIEEKLKSYDSP